MKNTKDIVKQNTSNSKHISDAMLDSKPKVESTKNIVDNKKQDISEDDWNLSSKKESVKASEKKFDSKPIEVTKQNTDSKQEKPVIK